MELYPYEKMSDQPEHHLSKDGSSTLYSNTFQQYYHNPNGAIDESRHVFFETPGLPEHLKTAKPLTILEVGFGTGLNFLLALEYYIKSGSTASLHFYSIEAFPIDKETALNLNYESKITEPGLSQPFGAIFDQLSPGMNSFRPLADHPVELHLFVGKFNEFDFAVPSPDFIFHDPFSPEVNEELWTPETFRKLRSCSTDRTVLSTYCAATKARAAMTVAGWKTARATGALGKREMTIASPGEDPLEGFKRLNDARLIERYENGAFD